MRCLSGDYCELRYDACAESGACGDGAACVSDASQRGYSCTACTRGYQLDDDDDKCRGPSVTRRAAHQQHLLGRPPTSRTRTIRLSVSWSVGHDREACKTAEPIETPFGMWTRVRWRSPGPSPR